MGKSWDTKKIHDFIETFENAAHNYMEGIGYLQSGYEKYQNNETFVGGGAEATKRFIGTKQSEFNRQQYKLSKEMIKRYVDLDDTFKTMVDPADDAKIDTDVVARTKIRFQRQFEEYESLAFAIQQKTMEDVDKFRKYCGDIEEVYVRDTLADYDEFCGTGGFLYDCIKKVEEFDDKACNRLFNSGIKDAIQGHIEEISDKAAGLDSIHSYAVEIDKQTISLVALGTSVKATVTKKSTPYADKNNSTNVGKHQNSAWLIAMKEQYGFTEKELKLIADAYAKFDIWIKKTEYNELVSYTNKEKIQMFFGYLSALNPGYSSSDPTFNKVNATSTQNAVYNLKEMGVEAEALQKALLRQHSICAAQKKRDFVHECAMYSLMPSSALNTASKLIKKDDLSDLIGFKGDVYSASMNEDDMKSDIAAVNIYNRMVDCQDGNIFNAMTDYCAEEKTGKINAADEFLKNYGDGDPDKGMEVIKRKLDNKTKGAKSLQGNKSDQDVEKTKKQFLDYLEKERSK